MPRLRRRLDPRGGLVEEEVHRPRPREQRRERVDRRLPRDPLAVPQLHDDVEHRVEHHVADENGEEEAGKVTALIREDGDTVGVEAPVGRVHDDEEEHAVGVHGLEGAPVAREEGARVVAAHEEDPLEDACIEPPSAHVVDLDAEEEAGGHVESHEENPEVGVAVQDADHADKDDEGERREGLVGVGVNVGVPGWQFNTLNIKPVNSNLG